MGVDRVARPMPTIPPVTASTTWLGSPRLLALAEAVESETGVWTEIVRSGEFFGSESWGDMVRRVSITAAGNSAGGGGAGEGRGRRVSWGRNCMDGRRRPPIARRRVRGHQRGDRAGRERHVE